MFFRRRRSKFSEPQDQPLFIAIRRDDPEMLRAYARAAATITVFHSHVLRPGDHMCSVKLRFRDPDESDGESFVYLWLHSILYHPADRLYSGTFFELPPELTACHHVGERIPFEAAQVLDWMVNDDGRVHGAFTMRVVRAHLPRSERSAYDRYSGISVWEPEPTP